MRDNDTSEFEVGQEVLLIGEVMEIDAPDSYYIKIFNGIDSDGDDMHEWLWMNRSALTWSREEGIRDNDLVSPRGNKEMVGRVLGIRKGHAWVDWSPFVETEAGFTSTQLTSLVLASEEAVLAAQEAAEQKNRKAA